MQKQTVIFEENPKWRIYKGKCFCQIRPLSRDRARILYLIIIWLSYTNAAKNHKTEPVIQGIKTTPVILYLSALSIV